MTELQAQGIAAVMMVLHVMLIIKIAISYCKGIVRQQQRRQRRLQREQVQDNNFWLRCEMGAYSVMEQDSSSECDK